MAAHQKKTRRLNAGLVFLDESDLMLLPVVRPTWSRRGCTPILWHRGRQCQKVSVIAVRRISPDDRRTVRLYFQLLVAANYTAVAVRAFVQQPARQRRAPLALVWDRSTTHRHLSIATFLDGIGSVQCLLPAYAPELNPVECVWSSLKTNPLANLACPNVAVRATLGRRHGRALQRRPHLLRSFFHHSPLSLRLR